MSFTRMQMRTTRPRDFCSKKKKVLSEIFFHKKLTESRLLYICPESPQRSSKFFFKLPPDTLAVFNRKIYGFKRSIFQNPFIKREGYPKLLFCTESRITNICTFTHQSTKC
jgi:hypothetical protein